VRRRARFVHLQFKIGCFVQESCGNPGVCCCFSQPKQDHRLTHEVLFSNHCYFPVVSQRRPDYPEIGDLFQTERSKSELEAEVFRWGHTPILRLQARLADQDSQDVAPPQRSACSAERNTDSDSTRTISPVFNNVPGVRGFHFGDILPGQAADEGQRPFSFWCSHGRSLRNEKGRQRRRPLIDPSALSAPLAFKHMDDNSAFRFHDRFEESELSSAETAVWV
jgi:hypothetical protein